MSVYRNVSERESVYLNIEEAELMKEGLYAIFGEDANKRDLICELIHELNQCIKENEERVVRQVVESNEE